MRAPPLRPKEDVMNMKWYPLQRHQWFGQVTTKQYVVWHGTAGRTSHTPVAGRPGKATTSIDAGIELTLDICRRNDIEPVFYYPSTTLDFPRCFLVATILCHSNCRADKTDLCLPKWVYEKIEAA